MSKPPRNPTDVSSTDDSLEEVDYRGTIPKWVQEVMEAHTAIEREDAVQAGTVNFMARALVIATMPYKDPGVDVYKRQNGDFKLRIVAGYEGGIPYGIYPRLLMAWVTTQAARDKSPVIELGDSLGKYLRNVLDLRSTGGGRRGASTLATEQTKRLFGSIITAQYDGEREGRRSFRLRNVLIADSLDLDETTGNRLLDSKDQDEDADNMDRLLDSNADRADDKRLWVPQPKHEAGAWKSQVRLSRNFYLECVNNPVPIDIRAYKALRKSPLAMDVYTWLTYKMFSIRKASKPIPWEALMGQFGSNYSTSDPGQAVRDFKKAFVRALKMVQIVYPAARVDARENGLVLIPSPTHVPRLPGGPSQTDLF